MLRPSTPNHSSTIPMRRHPRSEDDIQPIRPLMPTASFPTPIHPPSLPLHHRRPAPPCSRLPRLRQWYDTLPRQASRDDDDDDCGGCGDAGVAVEIVPVGGQWDVLTWWRNHLVAETRPPDRDVEVETGVRRGNEGGERSGTGEGVRLRSDGTDSQDGRGHGLRVKQASSSRYLVQLPRKGSAWRIGLISK